MHRTNAYGSSVTLPFYGMYHKILDHMYLTIPTGTGFQLIGGSDVLYNIKVDDEATIAGLVAPASEVLYARYDLTAGNHSVTLTSQATAAAPSNMLTFDKAIIYNSRREACVDDGFP